MHVSKKTYPKAQSREKKNKQLSTYSSLINLLYLRNIVS